MDSILAVADVPQVQSVWCQMKTF